ncbi:MAG: glycoside hydrolase family 3 C-terminal domain-containing protein [Solirubrobacteraceae bacterium]|nr:glycoside hydrolase family 3 C-terminal domain-containing protein [Solirubrobacteraceae bacterium]
MLLGRSALVAGVAFIATLASGATADAAACSDPAGKPWCDRALGPDARAQLLTAAMTQGEKLKLLGGIGPGQHAGAMASVPRLGVPVAYLSDGPVGVRQGRATQMPSPTALAASFDPALARLAGATIGDEARKKGNLGLLGPAADIMRVPYGGRSFESYGEDPHLASRMATAWIAGAQSAGVFATVKHYAINNQEGRDPTGKLGAEWTPLGLGAQGSRHWVNANVDERTMREIYLPSFEAAVRQSGVGSVMCAYNRINGPYACANRFLLADVLRHDWGFQGFVMSDWILGGHPQDAVAQFRNGLDVEMPLGFSYAPALLRPLLAFGTLRNAGLDEHVRRIMRTTIAYGILDDPPGVADDAAIDVDAHADAAQAVEEGGITLLQNSGVLPLEAGTVQKVAVLGPAAQRSASGGGSGSVKPFRSVSLADALTARAGSETSVTVDGTRDLVQAAAVARAADVAIVVVRDYETEGADRLCLTLQCPADYGDQDALIEAVAAAQPNTVVVLQTGAPVLTPWRERVAAVVQAWYPGQSGGTAITRVLFGDVDASGRLPMTFPASESDLPTAVSPRRYPGTGGNNVFYEEGVLVGYRWFDAMQLEPAFPFGHGLSYTRFAYDDLQISGTDVTFTVRNTGARRGAAVPQLYVSLPPIGAATVQPPWQLRGTDKVWLEPGESRSVTLHLDDRALSSWDGGWKRATGCVGIAVGRSSRDLPLRGSVC